MYTKTALCKCIRLSSIAMFLPAPLTKSQSAVASLSARKPTGPMRRALAKVGRDCVGALQFLHEGQEPGLAGAVAGRRAVGDEEIGSRSATSP